MCWKYEWARAINNLEWAKIHIKRLTTRWKSEAEVYRSYHGFKTIAESEQDMKWYNKMVDSYAKPLGSTEGEWRE